MDHTELTTGLYNKMAVEQNAYRTWLLDQIPGELLSHAYEYAVREDILAAVEELELSVPQAEALLASATPLADIYKTFCDRETAYLDVIRDCVEQRAAELLALRSAEHKRPLYRHDSFYARAHGELDQYRACQKANAACAQAIDAAIQAGFDGMYLNADVKGVLAEFGPERVTYVLAATIQRKSWDGRFSHSNQAWAAAVPMLVDEDSRFAFAVESHPAVLDGFVSMARKEMDAMREQPQKPSIKAQLAAKPTPGGQPDKPKERGER